MRLILASTSPHRAQILRDHNIEFVACPSNVKEKITPGTTPAAAAIELGKQKCLAVYASGQYDEDVVIGADTIVVSSSGELLSKPRDAEQATDYMQQRSGAVEKVITGFWICHKNGSLGGCEMTRITYSEIPAAVQQQIIASNEWQGVCGGLKVEGSIAPYVKNIEGEYENIRGLPIERLGPIIRSLLASISA